MIEPLDWTRVATVGAFERTIVSILIRVEHASYRYVVRFGPERQNNEVTYGDVVMNLCICPA